MLCPCGSQKNKNDCCEAIINNRRKAASPEELMRSRYCAYKYQNAIYLYNTYATPSQKTQSIPEILDWAKQTKWLQLVIIDTTSPIKNSVVGTHINTQLPTVTFSATYIFAGKLYTMTEKSRFTLEDEQWKYVGGDYSSSEGKQLPNRNEHCPCGSDKKFKRCCGS